jgi:hypothetical protein
MLLKDGTLTVSSFASTATPLLRYDLGIGSLLGVLTNGLYLGDCNGAATTDGFPTGTTSTGAAASHTLGCVTSPWWAAAGDVTSNGTRSYPALPQLPTYERPGPQAAIGACQVYYPGRYLGSTPLVLSGGTHYFASGVYYFERPLQITNGAVVVMGEGRNPGCTFDADAAFVPTAPRAHEITGKGATLVLGGGGNLSVSGNNTVLRINRRLSSSTTRGSEGVAIRSVQYGTATSAVEIPADVVRRADGTTIPVGQHSVTVTAGATAVKYATSNIAPTANIVNAQVGSGSVLDIDGYVFTPNGRFQVGGTASNYVMRLNGGVVASRITFALQNAPAAGNWLVGVVTEPIQRRVTLQASATVAGRLVTSVSNLEVNLDRSYAINDWVVDA